jgi:glycosyltransferase involved in cell wall biosynthesis
LQAEYDAVVTWGEKLSLAMLARQQFANGSKPHIAMMYQFEKPNIRLPLNAFKRNLHSVVTWSSVQRRALIERIGFPSERVYLIRHYVDQVFYSPRTAEEDMICAVGAEMRDYATFLEAVRGTGIRAHIATDHVRIPGRLRLLNDRRVSIDDLISNSDTQVTQGRMPLTGLRDLYARSRFVVVPLLPSDTDNGVTVILEAMAMGKPVICSRTRGQVDVIEEGVTGHYVPVGDAAAMRAAIVSLWNDPQRASQMGRNARALVEKHHTLEKFTSTARSAAEASLDGRPAPDTWWE